MPLSLNEIRARAFAFAKEWADEASEDAEAKSFWDGFFTVFGVHRRRVATFEEPVKKASGNGGYIDLLWRGVLLVEHKSLGKDLDRARGQAFDYFSGLKDRDLPRYVIVSDFARIRLYDLEPDTVTHARLLLLAQGRGSDPEADSKRFIEFPLSELPQRIGVFGFMSGYEPQSFGNEDPVNVTAAEKLGALHDLLNASGYSGHELEVFLVRVLFCLFADDTGIFERGAFRQFVEQRTAEDGSDLGLWLAKLFDVLNRPKERRAKALDEQLAAFPHVNGKLFAEPVAPPDFDSKMRDTLFTCLVLDWSRINPSIFGGMFQSIMDAKKRRNLGAHYTTETNIMKALRPLFLDALRAEFEQVRGSTRRLNEFHARLAAMRIMDPACGCGNFLVIAYRELRLLEIEVLRELLKTERNLNLDVLALIHLDVDQFYGIELEEWPAQIAQVALWLMDHLMNLAVSTEFGHYFARLPLRKAPTIIHGNALRMDWRDVVAPQVLTYIVGNPPFSGARVMSSAQKADLAVVFQAGVALLDYVSGWYWKSLDFMKENPRIEAALVSTNSITQGEQPDVLWAPLLAKGLRINFAHRTFEWESEARGKAAVHCVIAGFALADRPTKVIFDYERPRSPAQAVGAKNINPYLVDGPDVTLPKRTRPISDAPAMTFGSMANDDGHLLLTDHEKKELLAAEPAAQTYSRRFIQVDELLYGANRWCLWLADAPPGALRNMPLVLARVRRVAAYRKASRREATKRLADTPALFGEIRQPASPYLVIPRHTGESRRYIPMAYEDPKVVCGDANLMLTNATPYVFGILTSIMHMAWMRAVCGRIKSDYRYSAKIVLQQLSLAGIVAKTKRDHR
ncbi:DNA methyltransferase [Rhodopila sp.]|uniref:DNA methyltransferase n=1 Tax=Rhodopila sp. TaxID=2480087 RepID=UPI003D0DD209